MEGTFSEFLLSFEKIFELLISLLIHSCKKQLFLSPHRLFDSQKMTCLDFVFRNSLGISSFSEVLGSVLLSSSFIGGTQVLNAPDPSPRLLHRAEKQRRNPLHLEQPNADMQSISDVPQILLSSAEMSFCNSDCNNSKA